jgi:uncharacterized protein (TIGR02453 family)
MHLKDLVQFLDELGENNNRPWFIMNKPRYDILRAEFEEAVTQLITQLGRFDPAVAGCAPKKAIFRIHRDVRFAKDKSPYKTRFAAGITPNNLRRPSAGGGATYYFHIEPGEPGNRGGKASGRLLFGAGEYLPPPERLRAIRTAVVNDATGFSKMLKNKQLRATYGSLQEEDSLQRPPKGFDPDHEHARYLKLKSFFVWTEQPLDLFHPERLVPQLVGAFKDASALVAWLRSVPQPHETEE